MDSPMEDPMEGPEGMQPTVQSLHIQVTEMQLQCKKCSSLPSITFACALAAVGQWMENWPVNWKGCQFYS